MQIETLKAMAEGVQLPSNDPEAKIASLWRAKVLIPSKYACQAIKLSESELDSMNVLGKFKAPEKSNEIDWDLIPLTYGENAEVLKNKTMLMKLKLVIVERIQDNQCPDISYGQLERLERVVERLIFGYLPKATPYWDSLMDKVNNYAHNRNLA
jgi:hypothetical protein